MKYKKIIKKLFTLETSLILAVSSLAPGMSLLVTPTVVHAQTSSQTGGFILSSGSSHNTGNVINYTTDEVIGNASSYFSRLSTTTPSISSSVDGSSATFPLGATIANKAQTYWVFKTSLNMVNNFSIEGQINARSGGWVEGIYFAPQTGWSSLPQGGSGNGLVGAPNSVFAGTTTYAGNTNNTVLQTTNASGALNVNQSVSGNSLKVNSTDDNSATFNLTWVPSQVNSDKTVTGTLTITVGGKTLSQTVTMQSNMVPLIGGVGPDSKYSGADHRIYVKKSGTGGFQYSSQNQLPFNINYFKTGTTTPVPGLSPSSIVGNVTDTINLLAPGVTHPSNIDAISYGQYYYEVPAAPVGYTFNSILTPSTMITNGLWGSSSSSSSSVYYSPNPQKATFSYNYSSTTNVPAVPTTQTYNGYTDDVIDSSLTTTLGSKIPVGYYISSIKNNGTGTSYSGTSSAATLAAAGLSASSTYNATAANNSWSLTLSPQTQTETFTYGWSNITPGANGGPAGKLQGTLPTNKSYSGVTDSALTNPGVTDIPAGYYIKVTNPSSAVFGDESTTAATTMSNAINSVKGPSGVAGTFNGTANNFNVALFPKTVTGNYNYQWDSKAPNPGKSGTLPSNTTTSGLVGAYFDASKLPTNGGALPGYTQSVVAPDGYTYTVSGTTATWKNSSGTVIGTASVTSGTTALQYATSVNAYTPTGGTFTTTYIANTDSKATFNAQYTSDTPGVGTTPGKTPPTLSNPVASSVGTTGSSIPLPSFTAPAGYSIKSVVAPDGTTKSDISSALNAFPYYYSSGLSSNFVYNISANTQTGSVTFRYVSGTPGTDDLGKPSSSPTTPGKASALPNNQSLTGSTGAPLTASAFTTPTGYAVDHVVGPDGVSYNTMSDAQKANPYYVVNSNNFTVYFKALTSTPTLSFSLDTSSGVTVPSTPAAIQFKNTDGSVWTGQTGAVIPASVITATQNALVQTLTNPSYKNWAINQYTDPNNIVYTTNNGASLSTAVSGVGGVVLPSSNSYGVQLFYAGTISLSSAPNTIDFGSHVIVGTNKTYSGTLDNSATVTDDRAKFSPWTLTVSQKSPIQEVSTLGVPLYGGISFDGYLKFKGNTVGTSPIIVGTGTKSGVTTVLENSSKDFNLTVPVSYQKPNTKFEGEVDWNLNMTPQ